MRLAELLEQVDVLFQTYGPDVLELEIGAVHDYGDHCHTPAIVKAQSVDVVATVETAYSNSGLAMNINPCVDLTALDADQKMVVLLDKKL